MFAKCHTSLISAGWVSTFISNPVVTSIALSVSILKNEVDMSISYLPGNSDYNCSLTSPRLKSIVYHELGHAQHYGAVGCNFWTDYRNAIITEISKTNQAEFSPYGNGSDAGTAPILAIGEMWGNHCQYIYTNRRYGNGGNYAAFRAGMQAIGFPNIAADPLATPPTPAINAYLWAIENFNPNAFGDVHNWIPQGLPFDLVDDQVDVGTAVVDNVNVYSNRDCFDALTPNVRSIGEYRNRLLQLNNAQTAQVTNLFTSYNY